jgi:hypothetical protein
MWGGAAFGTPNVNVPGWALAWATNSLTVPTGKRADTIIT